jgi:N-acetylglucosaminyldiphosphoundecaprenol N-acetyl-beta-D-mannosaminyltransferase
VLGFDLIKPLIELAASRGYRAFFVGPSRAATDDIVARVREHHPDIEVCGTHDGLRRACDSAELLRAVDEARAELLFIGSLHRGSEYWLADHAAVLDVPFSFAVGRAYEYYAGRVSAPPEWAQRAGVRDAYLAVRDSGAELGRSLRQHLRPAGNGDAPAASGVTYGRRAGDRVAS